MAIIDTAFLRSYNVHFNNIILESTSYPAPLDIGSELFDYGENDAVIMLIGQDINLNVDGTRLGIFWSSVVSGDNTFEFRTEDYTMVGISAGAIKGHNLQLQGGAFQITDSREVLGMNNFITAISTSATYNLSLQSTNSARTYVLTRSTFFQVILSNLSPKGSYCTIYQGGAGKFEILPMLGATINNVDGFGTSRGLYARVYVECISNVGGSSAIYIISGDLEA